MYVQIPCLPSNSQQSSRQVLLKLELCFKSGDFIGMSIVTLYDVAHQNPRNSYFWSKVSTSRGPISKAIGSQKENKVSGHTYECSTFDCTAQNAYIRYLNRYIERVYYFLTTTPDSQTSAFIYRIILSLFCKLLSSKTTFAEKLQMGWCRWIFRFVCVLVEL